MEENATVSGLESHEADEERRRDSEDETLTEIQKIRDRREEGDVRTREG